eukprot:6176267-Amphidinium_carterae.1
MGCCSLNPIGNNRTQTKPDCVIVTNMCMADMEGYLDNLAMCEFGNFNDVCDTVERAAESTQVPKMKREKLKQRGLKSQLYGAYAKQGLGITDVTWRDRDLVSAVHDLIKASNPQLTCYTSFVVNCIELMVHRDKTILPGTYVWTVSFGSFQNNGGRLWRFDPLGQMDPPSQRGDSLPSRAKGTMTSTYRNWVRIHGEGWHGVERPKSGKRWSLSVFTPQSIQRLSAQHWSDLSHLGFPVTKLKYICMKRPC